VAVIELREKIRSDYCGMVAGERLPSLREMASRYGVSAPTIGKAVEVLASEGCLRKRQGSGIYSVGNVNREIGGIGRNRRKIGFVSRNLSYGLAHQALEGVGGVAKNNNVALEVAQVDNCAEEERQQIRFMIENGVEGIVLYPAIIRREGTEYLSKEFRDIPIVVIDLYQPTMERTCLIFDNYTAGRDMTRYLLSEGRKDIVFVRFEIEGHHRAVDDRVAGYCDEIRRVGNQGSKERVIYCKTNPENNFCEEMFLQEMKNLVSGKSCPDAIIAHSDTLSIRIIRFLKEQNISVPDDVIVCGFDHLQDNQIEYWPTTDPDFLRMGERAAKILFEMIASRNMSLSEVIFPCPLLIPHREVPHATMGSRLGPCRMKPKILL